MILGMLEHLKVELLGVVGLDAELRPKVCSVHRLRQGGTCAIGRAGVLASLDPTGPSYS